MKYESIFREAVYPLADNFPMTYQGMIELIGASIDTTVERSIAQGQSIEEIKQDLKKDSWYAQVVPSLYNYRWQQYRKTFLRDNPFCASCAEMGRRTIATVVDHIVAHRGDIDKFWDESNHQSLCKACHDSHKQRLEKSGRVIGCDVRGYPVSADHHWNKS